jgi:hypothetical protein
VGASDLADSLLAAVQRADDADAAWLALASAVDAAPGDLALGNALRLAAVEQRRVDAAIAHLDSLHQAHPELDALEVNLGLAHLDRLGDPELSLGDAGIALNRATRHFEAVTRRNPHFWSATYATALAELTWHSRLRHAKRSVDSLELCLLDLEAAGAHPDWIALVYLRLGDAHAKLVQTGVARQIYELGLRVAPRFTLLRDRLELQDFELRVLVDEVYAVSERVDTDLSGFWKGYGD